MLVSNELTHCSPLIQMSVTLAKWNMGEMCGLKFFNLWYVHTPQLFNKEHKFKKYIFYLQESANFWLQSGISQKLDCRWRGGEGVMGSFQSIQLHSKQW